MADKRITELNLHTSLTLSDVIPIVSGGETKKTTYGSLYYGIRDGLVSGSSQIILGDVTNFTEYSSSVESKIENLISATSSYLTSETDSQTLSIVGDQLSISNGNTVTLPTGSGGGSADISALNTFTSSQELLNTTFATTGSNTFEGNQQVTGWIDATDYISTDTVLYTNFIEENLTNGGLSFVAGGSGFAFNNDVEVTGSVIANDFTGSLFGTASVSNQLFVSQSTTNSDFKLLFATTGNGNKDVLQDTGTDCTYNPWTNTLTATNLSGTATNATNVDIATNSTNTNYYVTFGFGSGNNRVTIDGGGQFTYNPSTNTLTVPTVVGNLTGTATNATSASYAVTASYIQPSIGNTSAGASGTPSPLPLSKQVQRLTYNGSDIEYSLGNGYEGQIMHFVATPSDTYYPWSINIACTGSYLDGNSEYQITNGLWYPWDNGNNSSLFSAYAIFMNGAWCFGAGSFVVGP